MHILQTIVNDLTQHNGQNHYALNDVNQTFTAPGGRVATVTNGKLASLTALEPDEGARQVYHYFKFIRDRAIQPALSTSEPPLNAQRRGEIFKECIDRAFGAPLQLTTYEILSDRLCRDYPFFQRHNCSTYPADILQLPADALQDYVQRRIDVWKYEIAKRYEDKLSTIMNNLDNSLVEIILSMQMEVTDQVLRWPQKEIRSKLQPILGQLYRGGSLYELDKAKRVKTGQPCFDIFKVNKDNTFYGLGLYTSPKIDTAKKYTKGGTDGIILEITANPDSGLMQYDGPPPGKGTFFSGGQSSSKYWASTRYTAMRFVLHNCPFSVPPVTTPQNAPPAQVFGFSSPVSSASNPTPAFLTQQHAPVSNPTLQADTKPIINNVPHPLVGSMKCDSQVCLIVNPRLVKTIKAFDRELQTKIDLNFSAQEIVTHKLVPKYTPPLSQSQQSQKKVAKLIDPLTGQSSNATIFLVENKLPLSINRQRNRDTEVKFYTSLDGNLWLRVKPRFSHDCAEPMSNKPFVITYTRSVKATGAHHADVAKPIFFGINDNPTGAVASGSTCDVCLSNVDDGPTVRLPNSQMRHHDCHAHAIISASSSPGDAIHGNMSWQIDYSPELAHIAQQDPGSFGVIVTHFHFTGPHSYRGRQLEPTARHKKFTHYMPDSITGRQILKALQSAFMLGKVVTIDESHTTNAYGLCFNLHLRTDSNYGDPHGYPCPNWSQSLIDGLLSAGVEIDLDEQNPQLAATPLYKEASQQVPD